MESRIINLDVLAGLASLPADTFHCAMTSPPYWRLRSYPGIAPTSWSDGQSVCLGAEADPESFIRHLVEVFDGVRRVLRPDGVLFVNIGETYAANGGGGPGTGKSAYVGNTLTGVVGDRDPRKPPLGLKPGDRCMIPQRFVLAMVEAGWYFRDEIQWCKRSPMPSSQFGWRWVKCRVKIGRQDAPQGGLSSWDMGEHSHGPSSGEYRGQEKSIPVWKDCPGCAKCFPNDGLILRNGRFRTTAAHEPIFVFAKGERYFMDDRAAAEAVADPSRSGSGNKTRRWGNNHTTERASGAGAVERQSGIPWEGCESRNPRSWWPLSAEPLKEKHFAAFPTALVKKCLEMATSKAGCCGECGSPYAPIVESSRVPTRPGLGNKIWKHADGDSVGQRSNDSPNLDPQRHIAVVRAVGYRATCNCQAEAVPCRVFDPFLGSGTVGQVANAMGLEWCGVEGSAEYVEIAKRRVLLPLRKAKRPKKTRLVISARQRNLFPQE